MHGHPNSIRVRYVPGRAFARRGRARAPLAGRRGHHRVHRAPGGGLGIQGAVPLGRRCRRELAGRARSRHQHHGRRAHRHPPHHRRLRAAAAGRRRHRLGRRVQHRAHRQIVHQVRRRRPAHRGSGAGQALRPSSRQGGRRREEMVDRVKAAVDARTDANFVVDGAHRCAWRSRGIDRAHRARASPASRPAPT